MAKHVGVGANVDPVNTQKFSDAAAADFFRPRYVDDRFEKRGTQVLAPRDPIGNDVIIFELRGKQKFNVNIDARIYHIMFAFSPANQYYFFDISNLILEMAIKAQKTDGKNIDDGQHFAPINNVLHSMIEEVMQNLLYRQQ